MRLDSLDLRDWLKAVAVGIGTAVVLSAIMVPALKLGVSPLPRPLGLAFAETLFGRPLPLPVGLLFHIAWVTAWSVVFVVFCRDNPSFRNALVLGLGLWVLVLVGFFPLVGWGFLGLAVGPALIVGALVPHLLFAAVLWSLCRVAFRPRRAGGQGD